MNDSFKADAHRFRLSLAASILLNTGLLALVGWLGRPTDLSGPQARPHLRMVTFSVRPAPIRSARRGMETASRLTVAIAPSPRQPRPRSSEPNPRPRRKAHRRLSTREAAVPPPAFSIVTTTRPSARAVSLPARAVPRPTALDPPVQAPPLPRLPLPIRFAARPIRIAAVPALSGTMTPPAVPALPPPVPAHPMPPSATGRVAGHEASRGATGGGAGRAGSMGIDTNQKPGGPFGIGDGLAADVVTRHIVYVLDTSGSMKSRLDRAEDELAGALRGLRPGETFNIITFSGGSVLFDPDMAEAAPGNIQRASAFLSGLAASGDTDFEDAVVRALMLRDVNEVVILTDGVPTVGEKDPEKLAAALRRFNLRHARISTVGLVGRNPDGTDDSFAAAGLLQRIARESGGTSKLVSLGSASP